MFHLGRIVTAGLLLAAALGASGQTSSPSLLRQVFPNPSGQNGYEEYLRAADQVNDDLIAVYLDGAAGEAPTPDIQRQRAGLWRELQSLDYLAVQKAAVQRYGRALDLVAEGNLKPAVDPRDRLTTVKHPEFGLFRQIVRLAVARSYVQSSNGDVAGSVKSLLDALTFSRRFAGYTGISNSYSALSIAAVMDGFESLLPQMSLKDATAVESYVNAALQEPSPLRGLIEGAEDVHRGMLEEALRNPAGLRGGGEDKTMRDIGQRLGKSTNVEIQAVIAALQRLQKAAFEQRLADIKRPEGEWYEATASWAIDRQRPQVSASSSVEDVAAALFVESMSSYRAFVLSELRSRAQLRVLGLTARVIDYRWHHRRLPARLSDAAPEAETFDPLSGEPFAFEPKTDGSFRLYSKGRPEIGPVGLHYDWSSGGQPAKP